MVATKLAQLDKVSYNLAEARCPKCDRLWFRVRGTVSELEIRCPKCGGDYFCGGEVDGKIYVIPKSK